VPEADALGVTLVIRPIKPTDKRALNAAFERLSSDARHMRFLSHKSRLTKTELAYLTEVDHSDHEALVAIDAHTDRIVGVARYVRASPASDRAEVAITVADEWQRRGVGTALLTRLGERAREEGITRLEGTTLANNRALIALIGRLRGARSRGAHGTLEFVVELD
jgi:RimJ/RimL family protein N-acetyltransferase